MGSWHPAPGRRSGDERGRAPVEEGVTRRGRGGSDRTIVRVLGLLGAAVLLLLLPRVGWTGEAVRCRQVRHGDRTATAIAGHCRRPLAPRRASAGRASGSPRRAHGIPQWPAVLYVDPARLHLVRRPLVAPPGRLRRESDAALRDQLCRMRDIPMVQRFREAGLLVTVPAEAATYYVAGVSAPLRAARPWTKSFIEQTSRAFHRLFDRRLRITSLTRTRAVQRSLLRTNVGAAPAQGAVQSTHLTGATLDISKRALSATQVAWLRTVLDRLSRRGLIHVVEEFQAPHFHVMVTRRFLQYDGAEPAGPRSRMLSAKGTNRALCRARGGTFAAAPDAADSRGNIKRAGERSRFLVRTRRRGFGRWLTPHVAALGGELRLPTDCHLCDRTVGTLSSGTRDPWVGPVPDLWHQRCTLLRQHA